MIITDSRLEKNYNIALDIIKKVIGENDVKAVMREVIGVDISPRAVCRHGMCRYVGDRCFIEVSKHLFEVDDKIMINVLIHEILHTFKDTKNHNYRWKWYAKLISDNTEYKITRTANIEGVKNHYKYEITCSNCGTKRNCMRLSQFHLDMYRRKRYSCYNCRNRDFKIEDLKENKVIL